MLVFELADNEFGRVTVRCNPKARRVILRLKPDASVHITVPHKKHLSDAQELLDQTRSKVRKQRHELLAQVPVYAPGALVGRSHQLSFRAHSGQDITTRVSADQIIVRYPLGLTPEHPDVQHKVTLAAKKALRRQAAEFLPQRLAELSQQWGLSYASLRISSGSTRWGSCSSRNEISLNYSLMAIPSELTDYVICHELCHTIAHNHSPDFWSEVAARIPDWRQRRKDLRGLRAI